MNEIKYSFAYKLLRFLGFGYSPVEYGSIKFSSILKKIFLIYYRSVIANLLLDNVFFEPIAPRFLRPKLLRLMGARVGKNVFIGRGLFIDYSNIELLYIEDEVHIAGQVSLLMHKRDMSQYRVGYSYSDLGYKREPITLKKGCLIGQGAMVMPGINVGEGAIVAARSLIVKDVDAWTLVAGSPAKVLKNWKL